MPTFDTQAALQAGYSQSDIQNFLATHPEIQSSDSNNQADQNQPTDQTQQSPQTPQATPQNPSAAPVVGSLGQIGELVGAPVGFQNASISGSTDQQRGELAQTTQRLIQAASQQTDPVRRARILQVVHDNIGVMDSMAGTASKIRDIGQAATPDINVPFGGGTVTPATSPQQATGIALKTASAIPGVNAFGAGALYGAGNTMEEQGVNTTPGSVALHAATNSLTFGGVNKLAEAVPTLLSKTSGVPQAALEQVAKNPGGGKVLSTLANPQTTQGVLQDTQSVIKDGYKQLTTEAGQQLANLDTQFKPKPFLQGDSLGNLINLAKKYPTLKDAIPGTIDKLTPSEGLKILSSINDVMFGTGDITKADANQMEALRKAVKSWVIGNFGGEGGAAEQYLKNYQGKINVLQAADGLYQAFKTQGKGAPDIQQKALENMIKTFHDDAPTYLDTLKQLAAQTGHSEIVDNAAALHYQKIMPNEGTILKNLKNISITHPLADIGSLIKVLAAPATFPFRSPTGAALGSEASGYLSKALKSGVSNLAKGMMSKGIENSTK